jgi:serine/threonine protein phosphatase PrpC
MMTSRRRIWETSTVASTKRRYSAFHQRSSKTIVRGSTLIPICHAILLVHPICQISSLNCALASSPRVSSHYRKEDASAGLSLLSEDTIRGNLHWFPVFDGHGPDGHKCAEYATENIPTLFVAEFSIGGSVESALEKAHLVTHENILAESSIDTHQSGTTALSLLLENNKCFVSNVGDSTCILGSRTSTDGAMTAKHLCTEHTPLRANERERIERAGGVIMTVDQRDGMAPMNEDWNKSNCPPRVWAPKTDDSNTFPGCGFTRSIGDSVAQSLGVVAKPEIFEYALEKNDRVLIIASDGITECT